MHLKLIVGCGYVGSRVAKRWCGRSSSEGTVFAITRSEARAQELRMLGIKPIVWDWLSGTPIPTQDNWSAFTELAKSMLAKKADSKLSILIAVSHAAQPDLAPVETHTIGLANLKQNLQNALYQSNENWIYLSTTGVFGATDGGTWVDESSATSPDRPGSIAAHAAESWLQANISADRRVILRPAGIYGPDRVPRWQSIRDQVPIQALPESYLNLIHVDDLAHIIDRVSQQSMKHPIYCVCDDQPSTRREYYEFIARLGNWPLPIFEDSLTAKVTSSNMDRKTMGRGRSDGNKRIRNVLIKQELNFEFTYPSYREGLSELLEISGS